MAIYKEIADNKGQITTYHRIIIFAPNFTGDYPQISVTIAHYTSEQYREQEKNRLSQNAYATSTVVNLPPFTDDIYSRAAIYTALMQLPEFEGATEV